MRDWGTERRVDGVRDTGREVARRRENERHGWVEGGRERGKDIYIYRERERERETDRETETETERQRETETEMKAAPCTRDTRAGFIKRT